MYINPTLQTSIPADLQLLLDAVKLEIGKDINCAKIGVIQSFDAAKQEVVVKIAQQQVTSIQPDGTKTLAQYPELYRVPVQFPSGGGYTLTFPIAAGDECLVIFNDRNIDAWLVNGPGAPPITSRIHDLSDGIAIVGIRSNPRALANVSTTAVQLRSDDSSSFIEVNASGVRVHAKTVYQWDVNGYGQRITHTGGSNYKIDNYVTGAIVTTEDHPIAPPGPP